MKTQRIEIFHLEIGDISIYEDEQLVETIHLLTKREINFQKEKKKYESRKNSLELCIPRQVFFANCQVSVSSFAHYP